VFKLFKAVPYLPAEREGHDTFGTVPYRGAREIRVYRQAFRRTEERGFPEGFLLLGRLIIPSIATAQFPLLVEK